MPGAARLQLADGIPLLRPEEQVFTAMLDGWRNQQMARNLSLATVAARERAARAFTAHVDTFPATRSSAHHGSSRSRPRSTHRSVRS